MIMVMVWSVVCVRLCVGGVGCGECLPRPADKPRMGCGVCDAPELWRGAACLLCSRVRTCAAADE